MHLAAPKQSDSELDSPASSSCTELTGIVVVRKEEDQKKKKIGVASAGNRNRGPSKLHWQRWLYIWLDSLFGLGGMLLTFYH